MIKSKKPPYITKKRLLIILASALTIVALFSAFELYTGYFRAKLWPKPVPVVQEKVTPKVVAKPAVVAPLTVDRISIPSIGVDAAIQSVGVTSAGAMAVPSNITDVAWYKGGPVPGDIGSAVIDGHLDGPNGEKGVFYSLRNLAPGSIITVSYKEGGTKNFKVMKTKTYALGQATTDIFTSDSGSHLNLITCSGSWSTNQNSYSSRLVIFADLLK